LPSKLDNSTMEDFKIISENKNSLFDRKEIKISIEVGITPTHREVLDLISDKFSTNTENIKIKKISEQFGSHECTITANIYDSKKAKDELEKQSKKEIEAEKKQVEAEKQAEVAEEKPVAPDQVGLEEGVPSSEGKEAKPAESEVPKEENKEEEKPVEAVAQ